MIPREFRTQPEEDVAVGCHLPPTSARVEAFMGYFERRCSFASLGMGSRITPMAAAHHRLSYIHPFLGGNGHVSRLKSYVGRRDAARVTGLKERTARDLLGALTHDGILASETPKGPVSLRFSLDAIEILFPSLFPQT
jgi:Fic family protein